MSLCLFEGYGVELEYMIVDRATLAVRPLADRVLTAVAGAPTDVEDGPVWWSNELALHVLELKTGGPTASLAGWAGPFVADLRRIDAILEPMGAMLLGTGMHPFMDPERELQLWPHEGSEVYRAYDRIFGCRQHGFANVQSAHLNLSFAGDDEFGRLHAAVRVLLPLLPALAASSPLRAGVVTGWLDSRLEAYRGNQARVPAVGGAVVPEPVRSQDEYQARILAPMYAAIAPVDPEGVLRREFLNSRGAIARFDRSAIEIRLLDVQETPAADLAIARLVAATVRALVEERWAPLAEADAIATGALAALLDTVARIGPAARLPDALARLLGIEPGWATVGEAWTQLGAALVPADDAETRQPLATITGRGTLAERILRRCGRTPTRADVIALYRELAARLVAGTLLP